MFAEQLIADDPEIDVSDDAQRLEQLLLDAEHRRRVERIARKNTQGTALAWQDAMQEVHLKVLQAVRAQKFRYGGVEKFYRWATSVAYNAVIDAVRHERRKDKVGVWKSLDQTLPGTEMVLGETIADELDLFDAVERADLIVRAIAAIEIIDQRHANRGYLQIWNRMVQGKKQTRIAKELGFTQGMVSKRWRELGQYILEELGLLELEAIQQEKKAISVPRSRNFY
ncbi:sigma-70 family RNA polymerase sigma factor [Lusitaniella coriacea LEGE 07157]|uniref:Sigma-70 family RNA polymerase sigma factor n=1 Tax=Lusitaniella coriacea LEGE 07157 TaxID=945747 RepID=A0A8J7DUY4_9CYAN|nr:sigma-70 family RNA polymerase sigma factor [Lusitaniella coriacea]MBE9115130.1 sigma-70 family RNA polymerase sigma factor [Lusitaniella coriacea LEGE 07157]